jgi:rhodanese-related sulfurtransferase
MIMHKTLGQFFAIGIVSVTLTACGESGQNIGESFQQVARTIIHGKDQVSVGNLADWLIKGRQDFVLIDIRPQKAYEDEHIESAMNLPLTYLVEPGVLGELPSDKLIVLYSNGTHKAAQAAVLLRLAGIQASTLLGGYNAWQEQVLHPELAATTDDEVLEARERQAIACYFSGNYKGGTGQEEEQPVAFTPPLSSHPLPTATEGAAPAGEAGAVIQEGC